MFNGKYIFKGSIFIIFHCYVSLPECNSTAPTLAPGTYKNRGDGQQGFCPEASWPHFPRRGLNRIHSRYRFSRRKACYLTPQDPQVGYLHLARWHFFPHEAMALSEDIALTRTSVRPYRWSATDGQPQLCKCTRIWWHRPGSYPDGDQRSDAIKGKVPKEQGSTTLATRSLLDHFW